MIQVDRNTMTVYSERYTLEAKKEGGQWAIYNRAHPKAPLLIGLPKRRLAIKAMLEIGRNGK